MKRTLIRNSILFCTTAWLSGSVLAADSGPKDDVTNAAKKLADKANYSWKTTVVVPEGSQFRPGPTEGKTEKDGFTHVSMSFGDNTTQALIKGEKAAVTNPDGAWQSIAEFDSEGPGRFLGMMVRNMKTPAPQALELVAAAQELKKDGDTYAGGLTEEGVKNLMRFRRGGGEAPNVSNPKGSVKFWIKDGVLSKYEFKVQGKMKFNDNEFDVDRATTVEIKDIGTTKITVPDEAKKKAA